MSHIFISYSRRDIAFAQKVVDALAANDLDTWVDWKSIPKGEDWEQEIYRGIEEADAFLFLISPDSVASEMCNKEIAHAVKNGKRILPIFISKEVPDEVHKRFYTDKAREEISKRNYIFCREGQDDFNKAIEEMRQTIHTDYEWLKYHTELQVKALKWDQKKDASRLLRGKELREAEQQLAEVSNQEDPQPTKIQREYILASQRNEIHTRRQITIGLVVGLVIMIALSVFAWEQRNTAITETNSRATAESNAIAEANARATAQANEERQANLAFARQLALRSQSLGFDTNDHLIQGTLLAIESLKRRPTLEGNTAMGNVLGILPRPITQMNMGGRIYSLEFSPDGTLIAACNDAGLVKIWDTISGKEILELHYQNPIAHIAFSPDGQLIATADVFDTITVSNVSRGKEITKINSRSNSMEFNGYYLVSAGFDGIHVWDATNGQEVKFVEYPKDLALGSIPVSMIAYSGAEKVAIQNDFDLIAVWSLEKREILFWGKGAGHHITNLALSPDWGLIAEGSQTTKYFIGFPNTFIIIWNVFTGEEITRIPNGNMEIIEFSPNGRWIAAGGPVESTKIWDLGNVLSGESPNVDLVSKFISDSTVQAIAFSPNEKDFAFATDDGRVSVWDISGEGNESSTLQHFNGVYSLSVSPDDKYIATGEIQHPSQFSPQSVYFRLWDKSNGEILFSTKQSWRVSNVFFSNDEKYVAYTSGRKTEPQDDSSTTELSIIDIQNEEEITNIDLEYNIAYGWVRDAEFSPNAELIAFVSGNGDIHVQVVATRHEIFSHVRNNLTQSVLVAFDPTSNYLISGDGGGEIRIWELSSGNEVVRMEHPQDRDGNTSEKINSLEVSRDGKFILSASDDRTARIWEASTGKEFSQKSHRDPVIEAHFSPDQTRVVSVSKNIVALWDPFTGKKVVSLVHEGVNTAKFSSDGLWLVTGGVDGTIRVWEVLSGKEVAQMNHKDSITNVAFTSDNRFVISGSWDGTVRIWFWQPNDLIEEACHRLTRNFTKEEWKTYFGDIPYNVTCPNLPIPAE